MLMSLHFNTANCTIQISRFPIELNDLSLIAFQNKIARELRMFLTKESAANVLQ